MALEWTVSGTHDRSSPALPATGKPFDIRATIARLSNGKITYNVTTGHGRLPPPDRRAPS
jgi:hypothetical protein